jgi:putative PIN family toxin of toxin-antitoxin system
MRAVVDTNVWISALLNAAGPPARVLTALRGGNFELISSLAMLDELEQVLARPRFAARFGVTAEATAELLGLLAVRSELAATTEALRLCRDPKDDMVIETTVSGGADVLITRDDDLKGESELVVALQERGVEVVTVQRILAMLDSGP